MLLINDGSTDGSLDVCREFQNRDDRVKVFDKENGGLCSARNYGLDHASGDYIAFIDNDDEYVDTFLEVAAENLENFGADIFRCNRTRVQIYDDGSRKTDVSGVPEWVDKPYFADSAEVFSKYYSIKKSGAMYGIWNGVFKAELFDDVRFDTRIRYGGEDWMVNLQLYNKAKSVVFVKDSLYMYYRRVSHSTSAKFDFNRIDAIIWVSEYEHKMLTEKLGKDSENVCRANNAIYLVQTIKILENDNCPFIQKEKYEYLRKLRKDKVFLQDLKTYMLKKPIMENACLWLYAHNKIGFMYRIVKKILKKRGNV